MQANKTCNKRKKDLSVLAQVITMFTGIRKPVLRQISHRKSSFNLRKGNICV